MPINEAYRAEWVQAGYGSGMASAIACRPPSRQFLRVYKLMHAQYLEALIVQGRIKVSTLQDLNDPFELLGASVGRKEIRAAVKEHRRQAEKTTGVLCFARDWRNPVMWTHYADNHRGVCLGFDVPRGFLTSVKYEDGRLLAALEKTDGKAAALSDAMKEALRCTKSSYWSHEEELRRFLSLADTERRDGLHFTPLAPQLILREVILGAKCELKLEAVRTTLSQSLHGARAIAYPARLAWQSFHVVPQESKVP